MDTEQLDAIEVQPDDMPQPYWELRHWWWFAERAILIVSSWFIVVVAMWWFAPVPALIKLLVTLLAAGISYVALRCFWWMWRNRPYSLGPDDLTLRVHEEGPDNFSRLIIGDSGIDSYALRESAVELLGQSVLQRLFFRTTYSIKIAQEGRPPRELWHVRDAKRIIGIVQWGNAQEIRQSNEQIELLGEILGTLKEILLELREPSSLR